MENNNEVKLEFVDLVMYGYTTSEYVLEGMDIEFAEADLQSYIDFENEKVYYAYSTVDIVNRVYHVYDLQELNLSENNIEIIKSGESEYQTLDLFVDDLLIEFTNYLQIKGNEL